MDESLRKWGIGLIVLGVLHFFLGEVLDPFWGSVIILLGVLNLLIRKRGMFIANGCALICVGLMNSASVLLDESGAIAWLGFGVIQVIWGIQEGIAGWLQKARKKAFAIFGLILNLAVILFLVTLST